MKRAAFLLAVVSFVAADLAADDLTARGQAGYQFFDLGRTTRSGFRQTYDLGLRRGITANSRFSIFVRAEDFRGTTESVVTALSEESHTRQLQPIGELMIDAETLRLQFRTDWLRDETLAGAFETTRETERTSANLMWDPVGLPSLQVIGSRNVISEEAGGTYAEESAYGTLRYPWRGLQVSAHGRHLRAEDTAVGYERTQDAYGAQAAYTVAAFQGRFTLTADAMAERSNITERATVGDTTIVPVPVRSRAALHVVDETPLDGRDHPLVAVPALRDGSLDGLTSIALGPESRSFQNLALDFGRLESVDELRVSARDASGNPLRNGGGVIVWDVYVSDDGIAWAPVGGAASRFDVPLSAYLVSFSEVTTRWIKIVSFGVHFEQVFVTELQAYDIAVLEPGRARRGTQDLRSGIVSVSATPHRRVTVSYNGIYSQLQQEYDARPDIDNTTLDQSATVELQVLRHVRLRGSGNRTDVRGYGLATSGADHLAAAIEYAPTSRLRIALEAARQSQTILGIPSTISTRSVRLYGLPVRALLVTLDAGVQSQTVPGVAETGERFFANLSSTARLTRTTRLVVLANVQRARREAGDSAVLLLGVPQDDRYSAEMTWQPGRPLLLSARLGWSSDGERQGLTQRYRAEWYPFADGSISLAGSYDEDIDPISDRRSRRLVLTPRWTISRYLILDLSYTAVESEFDLRSDQQKTFYATLTVTK